MIFSRSFLFVQIVYKYGHHRRNGPEEIFNIDR